MNITDYHAKLFVHELTRRCPADSAEKLAGALVDAQDEFDRRREQLIAEIEGKLQQKLNLAELFKIRWKMI